MKITTISIDILNNTATIFVRRGNKSKLYSSVTTASYKRICNQVERNFRIGLVYGIPDCAMFMFHRKEVK